MDEIRVAVGADTASAFLDVTVDGQIVNALANPSAFGWPDASNTGPSDEGALVSVGSVTTAHDGQVIENFSVSRLTIQHNNVTVRNFRVMDDPSASYLVRFQGGYEGGAVFEDGEIACTGPSTVKGLRGVTNAVVRRCNIHHVQDGASNLAGCLIEDSFIHDVIKEGSAHNDCLHISGSDVVVRHNTLLNVQSQTSVLFISSATQQIDGVLVEDNLLNGGNYTIYSKDRGAGSPINDRILNNRFGRAHTLGPATTDGFTEVVGNVYDDDNSPVF